ncbi:MAG: hypothetical protein GXY77_19360 [Fibrobacter sp.]|nr:hypothetical protein [Fibrobacter sp.]
MTLSSLYYSLKPGLPRFVQLAIRRTVIKLRTKYSRNIWPINESCGDPPSGWQGWPDGKQFAFVLTHDVESQRGLERIKQLAEIDREYGFKSAFNIVPCKYPVPEETRSWLLDNGFEIGVHDYNHDGKLYNSEKIFNERAQIINSILKKWNVTGFRSAAMHHNLEWIAKLDIDYDCSTFDTDPFEPQPDGVNTIFPYWYQSEITGKGFVEIPYTLPQDFTLFVLKKEKDCSIWKEKLEWIAEKGGMATVIVHPDYIFLNDKKKHSVDEYSSELYIQFLEHIKSHYKNLYWNALPGKLSEYIKKSTFTQIKEVRSIT